MNDTQRDYKYDRAKAYVTELKEFYTHLISYLIMVPVFIFINYYTTSFPWAIFPIVGWGIGVFSHGAQTFGWNPLFNKDWEKRKIDELLRDDEF
ncbi:2TM domain-containing protein [uncultured Dokdonia sp.]|uniref:2TM domain-containing protein n=1 Tax=uncultured Dokdonia sp. TaxID=575653 RepID=UPI00261D7465|nr:2TM domain-containing protein [uncultured Dokdonia sp.]